MMLTFWYLNTTQFTVFILDLYWIKNTDIDFYDCKSNLDVVYLA